MSDNSFKVKNSLVLTPVNLATLPNPQAGDLACDINDSNKIKRYDAATSSWVEVGDFKGPASSTDDALVKFDGTTGKLVQNTAAILSDAGALSGLTGVSSSGSATFSGALNTSSNTTESAATGSSAVITSATTSVIRLTNTSLVSVGGYAATTAGRRTTLINATGRDVIIKHEDSSVTAAQRISLGSGADISLPSGGSIDLIYNATTARHQAVGPFSSRSISANLPDARPSLNLDFANSKTLDPRVTFSRNSVAHKVNEKGLLELVPENTARFDHDPVTGESKGLLIEEARTNLLSYTENFDNAYWTSAAGDSTVNANLTIAPDGTLTADKLVPNTNNNNHFIRPSNLIAVTSGQTYTASCFFKAGEYTRGRVTVEGIDWVGGVQPAAGIDLTTGVVYSFSSSAQFNVQQFPNGWYRLSITMTATANFNTRIGLWVANPNGTGSGYAGDGISGLFIWGAQLEVGSFPTSYMPSSLSFTSRASSASYIDGDGLVKYAGNNVARQNYLPSDLSIAPKLLLEESRTNLFEYSQEFDNSYWGKTRSTVNSNMTIAPDGTLTADKLIPNTDNNIHNVSRSITTTIGTSYTITVYAKAGEYSSIRVRAGNGSGSLIAASLVNLTTGQFMGSETAGTIVPMSNGWYRVSTPFVAQETTSSIQFWMHDGTTTNFAGNGIDGLFIWGAQLEVGAYPTSYIQSSLSFTSRSSIGTYVDSDGLVKTAASNVARNNYTPSNLSLAPRLLLEESRTNLLTYTENFDNAYWAKSRVYIQADAEIAPDGSRTADKLVEDTTANNTHFLQRNFNASASTTYTYSIFVKAGERTFCQVQVGNFVNQVSSNTIALNLVTGEWVATDLSKSLVEKYPNGWFRVSTTITTISSNVVIAPTVFVTLNNTIGSGGQNYTGDGTSGVFIWGAQLEEGAYPTSYIPSSQTFTSRASTGTFIGSNGLIQSAAINVARQNYNPLNLALAPKLLLEESRTNLFTRSEEFNDAAWTKSNLTVLTNATVAPDGATAAEKMVEDTNNNTHIVQQTISYTSGLVYSQSVFAKASERSVLQIRTTIGTTIFQASFNLETGTISNTSTGTRTSIQAFPNGWYRCSITFTSPSSIAGATRFGVMLNNITQSYQGDGTSGLFIWGAQLEVGAYPTSYIPTVASSVTRSADVSSSASVIRSADVSTSAAVTRAADVSSSAATTRQADLASMTGENFSSWYRQDEGTIVTSSFIAISESQIVGGGNRVWELTNSQTLDENRIAHFLQTNLRIATSMNTFGVSQLGSIQGTYNLNAKTISVVGIARDNFIQGTNGVLSLTDSSATLPTVNQFLIGNNRVGSGQSISGHISSIIYYPERLSNAQIQALSGTNSGLVGSSADQAPTNSMLGSLAFLDKLVDSSVVQIQPAPASFSAGGSLSASNVRSKIVVFNGSSASLQLPTGVSLELSEMSRLADASFDFSVIASGVGSATLTVNTGVTIVGNAVVSSGATGMFRARRTSANNYVVYRIG